MGQASAAYGMLCVVWGMVHHSILDSMALPCFNQLPTMTSHGWHWEWCTIAFGGMTLQGIPLDDITLDSTAWHWAAMVIHARHPPIAAASMPLTSCQFLAVQYACHQMTSVACHWAAIHATPMLWIANPYRQCCTPNAMPPASCKSHAALTHMFEGIPSHAAPRAYQHGMECPGGGICHSLGADRDGRPLGQHGMDCLWGGLGQTWMECPWGGVAWDGMPLGQAGMACSLGRHVPWDGMFLGAAWHGMPLGQHWTACPWGRLGWHALVAAWDSMPLGQRGMPCPWGRLGWYARGVAWDGMPLGRTWMVCP
jgi:hypothetical protein